MLNYWDYKVLASAAIDTRPCSKRKSYHLCHFNNSISCLPAGHTPISHKIFICMSESEMQKGFNVKKWNTIANTLNAFYQGKYPCEIDQKA